MQGGRERVTGKKKSAGKTKQSKTKASKGFFGSREYTASLSHTERFRFQLRGRFSPGRRRKQGDFHELQCRKLDTLKTNHAQNLQVPLEGLQAF